MVKISRTKHVTRRGVVKRNPRRKGWFVRMLKYSEFGKRRRIITKGPFKSEAAAKAWADKYLEKVPPFTDIELRDIYKSAY